MSSLPYIAPITQLSPFVTRILGQNASPFTLQGTNTYLIGDPKGRSRVLLDTGSGHPEYADLLGQYLKTHKLSISAVAITHHHPDHINGVKDVLAIFPNATVHKYIYQDEAHLHKGWKVEHWADGAVISAAGVHLKAYHTPGHCEDHLSIWLEEEHILFSGDNLLGHGSTVFNDYTLYTQSLIRMRDLPGLGQVYPGHGVEIENGVLAFNHYLEHRRARETEILKALKAHHGPMTTEQIVEAVYRDLSQRPERIRLGAVGNTMHYLRKLEHDRSIHKVGDDWAIRASSPNKM